MTLIRKASCWVSAIAPTQPKKYKIGNSFIPYAAPSTGAFDRNSPLGVRQGCRTLPKGQEAPFGNP